VLVTNTRKAFQRDLQNCFRILQEEQKLIIDSYRRKQKEDWIKPETWTTIYEKRQQKKKVNDTKSQRLREQLQARYLELDKEMKRPMKGD